MDSIYFNSSKIVLAVVAAVVFIFAVTACAGDSNFYYTDMVSPVPSPANSNTDLVDRSLGFLDGCVAAGESTKKCVKLQEDYVRRLKELVQ